MGFRGTSVAIPLILKMHPMAVNHFRIGLYFFGKNLLQAETIKGCITILFKLYTRLLKLLKNLILPRRIR
jgi:hypothetical protein